MNPKSALIPDPEVEAESPFDWPIFGLTDDVRSALAAARAAGAPAVLATLYAVAGGAPRGVGAQMLFAQGGMTGFLSGGCIEADVALQADEVLETGAPRRIVYGEGGPADIRLPCGSRIDVLLERIAPDDATAGTLLRLTEARRPALWLTDGVNRACFAEDQTEVAPDGFAAAMSRARGGETCGASSEPFTLFRLHNPPLRLIVIGGDPIALAVVRLAAMIGIETVLVRPKGPATPPPLPLKQYLRGSVEDALAYLKPDPWTAVAVLTHELDQEHAALKAALATEAGYIGALGSRRRIPERLLRLEASGVPSDAAARVHAPIGLAIGGKSPWDIAVSIIAEIVAETGHSRLDAAAVEPARSSRLAETEQELVGAAPD